MGALRVLRSVIWSLIVVLPLEASSTYHEYSTMSTRGSQCLMYINGWQVYTLIIVLSTTPLCIIYEILYSVHIYRLRIDCELFYFWNSQ